MLVTFQRLGVAPVAAQMFRVAFINTDDFLLSWDFHYFEKSESQTDKMKIQVIIAELFLLLSVVGICPYKYLQNSTFSIAAGICLLCFEPAAVQLAASQSPAWDTDYRPLIDLDPWLIPSHCSLNDTNYSPSGRVLCSDKPKISLSNYQNFLSELELMAGLRPGFVLSVTVRGGKAELECCCRCSTLVV